MITCSQCHQSREPAASEAHIAICAFCGATLVMMGPNTRIAKFNDLESISRLAEGRLRRAHAALVRAGHLAGP
jgi:PHP family Zn ribbon phosphoesterase